MEKVKGEIFYHINAKNGLNPYGFLCEGDNFDTNKFNPFRNSYEVGSNDYNINPLSSAMAYWRFTKEFVFEQTRIELNNNLPSRWKCIWLCNEEQLENWLDEFRKENKEYQVLKVKVEGIIFEADAYWVETDKPKPLNEIRKNARHYWKGNFFRIPSKGEILFEGIGEVVEVLEYQSPNN
jgi:hypothetical protein